MEYTYNKEYLMRDNKPWFPVMGEFHYSRYRMIFGGIIAEDESRRSYGSCHLCILDPP